MEDEARSDRAPTAVTQENVEAVEKFILAGDAYTLEISEVSEKEWTEVFSRWFKRMDKCIHAEGEYFEKINISNK